MAAFKAILRVRSSRPAAVLVSLVLWMGCGTSVATAGILSAAQEQLLNSAATAFAQGDYRPAADALPELENTYMGPWVGYWSLQPRLNIMTQRQYQRYTLHYPGGGGAPSAAPAMAAGTRAPQGLAGLHPSVSGWQPS